jgi:hypothetical protein
MGLQDDIHSGGRGNDLRAYTDMVDMLYQEASFEISRKGAEALIRDSCSNTPDLKYLVLFIEPRDPSRDYYLLVPVPTFALKSLKQSEQTILTDGRHPVAYWVRESQSTVTRADDKNRSAG